MLVAYFLNLTKGSYQQELDNFFSVTHPGNPPAQMVTKSALSQARKQLSHTAFIDLNRQAVDAYYAGHPEFKTWHGFRLCAIDGSQLRVPNEADIVAAFGVHPSKGNQQDCPLALVSVYYDVLNHISIDSSINPTAASERDCAAAHLNYAHSNDLSILDRGYNAFWLYALYEATGRYFCMRAKINQGMRYQQFAESGKAQALITLEANPRAVKQCLKKGLSTQPLRLRLIRVELVDGEVEVLITNLMDEGAFPASEFKALYHLRWCAEENYKRLKQWVEIENFSGKSALSVRQDFYAKVLSTNLTAMVANAAQQLVDKATGHRKHEYQVNFAQALSKMKNTLIELLLFSARKLKRKLEALIDYIALTVEPIRRGRRCGRSNAKPKNRIFYCSYKRAK
jgi:Transposase DDE domain